MQDALPPPLPKWPFYLSDAILLAAAGFITWQGTLPLGRWEILGSLVCVTLGAVVAVLPFVLEYRALARLTEAATLAGGLAHIKEAQTIATRIAAATDNWQAVHEQSAKTVATAREIADRMAAEVRDFTEFLRKANDTEKATLRLEVEKLHRAEADWLQVLVHIFDHVYALHSAGVRSGQPRLIEQLTQFQEACRDAARRIGLSPFVVPPGEPFDPKRHQTPDGQAPAGPAIVRETVATGYTFQGRLLRPALVKVDVSAAEPPAASQPTAVAQDQDGKPAADNNRTLL